MGRSSSKRQSTRASASGGAGGSRRNRSQKVAACVLVTLIALVLLFQRPPVSASGALQAPPQSAPPPPARSASGAPAESAAAPAPVPGASSQSPAATPVPPVDKTISSFLNLHQWGSVTLFHGLPSDHVRAIAQDQDGVMWLGTDAGLAKYDGRRIQKVTAEGLPAGRIRILSPDSDGSLWVGTDLGAGRLSGSQFHPIKETVGMPISAIEKIDGDRWALAGEQGTIFICSVSSSRVDTKTLGPKDFKLLNIDQEHGVPLEITSLAALGDALLVGTSSRGLLRLEGASLKEEGSRPRPFFIKAIAVAKDGRAWLGADTAVQDSGLYQAASPAKLQKIGAAVGSVSAIHFDSSGDAWVATDKHGVFHFKDDKEIEHFTFDNTAGGLRSNLVYSIFTDREGVFWFGTDRGVCRYDPGSPHAERIAVDPQSNFVRSIHQSASGLLWCGTNRGLFVRDRASVDWVAVDQLQGKAIYSMIEAQPGRLLIGSSTGLYLGVSQSQSDIHGWQFQLLDSASDPEKSARNVRALCAFRSKTYIGCFGHGVERIDGASQSVLWGGSPDDRDSKDVVALYAESADRLWIGTARAGVFVYDGNTVARYPGLEQLAGNAVWSIAGDTANGLWFGTARGLYRLLSGKLEPALEGIDARGVVPGPAPGWVWCASAGSGLYQVSMSDSDSPKISRLDMERGLPSDSVFAITSAGQGQPAGAGPISLWIGTSRGLAHYDAGSIPPVVKITRLLGKRAYQPEELRGNLNLSYPQNSLLMEVSAISSRTFPEQFQYAFLLLDSAGTVIKQKVSQDSQFVMDSLRPGAYKVQARAYSNDLIPSEPVTFGFVVPKAPFPFTSAALSVLLLFALAALGWGYYQNLRLAGANVKLAGANRQLAETRQELANETENERRRIARDLHDQTLSDLRRLLLMADQLAASGPGNGNGKAAGLRGEIESISTEIRRICEDLSPSALANVGLMAALEWAVSDAVAHLSPEQQFDYEFVCGDDVEERLHLDAGSRIQVYRIVQEAVSNVCHHAGAKHVKLQAEIVEGETLKVTLEDDGAGFDTSLPGRTHGRGLNNIRSRASLIDADVNWEPRTDGGTTFVLRKRAAARASSQAGHPSNMG
jgi:signal transduction histidine kinase/ligand-binding sensor domain-containing protein